MAIPWRTSAESKHERALRADSATAFSPRSAPLLPTITVRAERNAVESEYDVSMRTPRSGKPLRCSPRPAAAEPT
jgi:hypothetical protein